MLSGPSWMLALAFGAVLTSAAKVKPLRRQRAPVITQCSVPNTVALTFDDGPWIYLNDIVDTLDAAGAKGTFFFNGNNCAATCPNFKGAISAVFDPFFLDGCIYENANSANIKRAYDRGHMVASHTWAHHDLTTLSRSELNDEMVKVEQAVARITGAYPAFTRPPYGAYNDLVLEAASARKQAIVMWDLDSEDSMGATVRRSEDLYSNAISAHPATILTLNHETIRTTSTDVLPYAIEQIRAAGYRMVTLAECLGLPAYLNTTAPTTRDASWYC